MLEFDHPLAPIEELPEVPPLEVVEPLADTPLNTAVNDGTIPTVVKPETAASIEQRIENDYKNAAHNHLIGQGLLLTGIAYTSYIVNNPDLAAVHKAQISVEFGGLMGLVSGIAALLARSGRRKAERLEREYYMDPALKAQQAEVAAKESRTGRMRNIFRRKRDSTSPIFAQLVDDSL